MNATRKRVVLSGGFDNLGSKDIRFLQEASKLGSLSVLLWPDDAVRQATGRAPRFPLAERHYLLKAIRYVSDVIDLNAVADELPAGVDADLWIDRETANPARENYCRARGIAYRQISDGDLGGFPEVPPAASSRPKVIVTGCFDWFHSGHARFFEEASGFGDLYVVVGNDANIRLLKGEGHPLLPQDERRYVVGSIRCVQQALISSGSGWLDADAEIERLKPKYYVVNEDGDKGDKRGYCAARGIEYVVLKRTPAPGLPRRSSTDLRGF
jgi:cytidyltransferase-like protein